MIDTLIQKINEIDKPKQVLLVGGAVRDYLLDKKPKDYDLATNIDIEKIERKFDTVDIGSNKNFGIVIINWRGTQVEVAHFRSDGKYEDNRRPTNIKTIQNFKEDSRRRDFTINAMGMNIDGDIIDYWNGKKDLEKNLIRTVGNPDRRFQEDALRMLRAIRFAVQLNFEIDKQTKQSIWKNRNTIKNISQERITDEIIRMASTKRFHKAIQLLDELELLKIVLPHIFEYKKMYHNPDTHPEGNLYKHIIECLKIATSDDPKINLSILFHDLGKLQTCEVNKGRFHYYKHSKVGLDIFDDEIKEQMRLSNEMSKSIKYGIKHHMKLHNLHIMKSSKIQKLIENKNWYILKEVGRADCLSRGDKQSREWWKENKQIINDTKIKMENSKKYKDIRKVVDGIIVMEIKKIKPGPKVGKIIQKTTDWIIDENIDLNDTEQIYDYIRRC